MQSVSLAVSILKHKKLLCHFKTSKNKTRILTANKFALIVTNFVNNEDHNNSS